MGLTPDSIFADSGFTWNAGGAYGDVFDDGRHGVEPEQEGMTVAPDDPAVVRYFGAAYPAVAVYARLLADEGVTRGLIGPREVPRLWERHVLNCAAVTQFLPASGTVIDIGSGAGLPGIVLAAMRPDLTTVLVEPMERRVRWLREVVDEVGLTSVEIIRGRAEDLHGSRVGDAVTARAVAPLDRLAGWTMPLLAVGGSLLALKGQQAADELSAAEAVLTSWGGGRGEVMPAYTVPGIEPTAVVRVIRERDVRPVTRPSSVAKKTRRTRHRD